MPLIKKEVERMFREQELPYIRETEKEYGNGVDTPMRREAWNNFVDYLNRDGQVTDWQAFNWTNPY